MGPALTTGWCRVINGLHREINCSAAISSTRKTQPLYIWGILWTCGHGNKYVFSSASIYILYLWVCTTWEQKGVVVGGGKWNCSLLWKQCASSQHSLNPACLCAPSSFYSLFSDMLHFSILWTFISMGGIQNKQTHLVLPGYHRHTHSL